METTIDLTLTMLERTGKMIFITFIEFIFLLSKNV